MHRCRATRTDIGAGMLGAMAVAHNAMAHILTLRFTGSAMVTITRANAQAATFAIET